MNSIIPQPDGALSPEYEALAARLTDAELEAVDLALLSNTRTQWRKVARIVALTMWESPGMPRLPDAFFSRRIYRLVEIGKLELQGASGCMGFCEVRIKEAVADNAQPNH